MDEATSARFDWKSLARLLEWHTTGILVLVIISTGIFYSSSPTSLPKTYQARQWRQARVLKMDICGLRSMHRSPEALEESQAS